MKDNISLLPDSRGSRHLESSPAAVGIPAPPTPVEAETNRLTDYVTVLRRRKLALLLITLLGVAGALAVSLLQHPTYRATASVEVQGINQDFLNLKDVSATVNPSGGSPEASVETEVASLEEESLLERVVLSLGLAGQPEFSARQSLLASLEERLGRAPRSAAGSDTLNAVSVLKSNMTVATPKQGRIIRVTYESHDPALAAGVANALVETLIKEKLEVRWDATQQIAVWLEPQLTGLTRNLAESENRLQKYAQSQGLLFTGGAQGTVEENHLRLLQEEVARARADRISKQSLYDAGGNGAGAMAAASSQDRIFQENQIKLVELKRQLAELSAVLKPENYRVAQVQAQIAELETAQKEEFERIRQRLEKDFRAAQARERMLDNAYARQAALVSNQSAKATVYDTLKREVEVNRRLYEAMMQKAKEAGIASAIRPSNIRLVSAAKPPAQPYKPNLPLNLSVGLFAGLTLGVGFVVASAQSDRRLRLPGEAGMYLNVPELGAIPRARRGLAHRLIGRGGGHGGLELVPWDDSRSVLSESFRGTLTSLLFTSGAKTSPEVFVVTSPLAAEGKTTVVSNLGAALAEIKRRVLLVDADLRGPKLHTVFGLGNDSGLSSLLAQEEPLDLADLDRHIRPTEVPNLYVMTSGPTGERVTALLHSPRSLQILSELRRRFDHVIVDAPPTLLFADARIIARATDGVVLVLRANRTRWPAALAAAQRLQQDGIPLIGTVLNDWTPDAASDTYGYRDFRKYYTSH